MDGEARASIPYVAALDGTRGLAVAGVLLFHGGHLRGGYLGVDVFFVLSGFLITSLLLAESRRTGSVGLGGFWSRRARRLLPALGVLMAGVALYAATVAKPTELEQIRGDALATLAYVANWRSVFAHADYWALFRAPSPLNHTWSLAIEEQFYVVWPLAFVGLLAWWKRNAPKAVLVTALALAVLSSALLIGLYDPANPSRAYFGTDTRAAGILFGAALAAWLAMKGPVKRRGSRVAIETLGLVGAGALAIAWMQLDGQSSRLYRGGFLMCGLAATAVIAAAVHPERLVVSRVLSFRPLRALGLVSYGVYLYHWPIDVYLDAQRVGFGGWRLFGLQTAVTLALAVASHRFIEMPIRRGALSRIQLRRFSPAVAIGLVVALVVSTTGARSGVAAPRAEQAIRAAATAGASAPAGARKVMIVGNSVAYSLGVAFKELHASPPVVTVNAGIPACTFPPEITITVAVTAAGTVNRPPCHPDWEAAAVDAFDPDVVFWVVSDAVRRDVGYRGRSIHECEEPYESIYRRRLRDEIARLGARGAKVVITTQAYVRVYGFDDVDRQADCNNRLRRVVAAETGAQLVDLFGYTCPEGACRGEVNGVTLRPDGQHYEGPGGVLVAQWLMDQVRAR